MIPNLAATILRAKPDEIAPIAPRRVHFGFDADEELERLIREARARLRHKYPGGRLEHVILEMARSYLEATDPGREPKRKADKPPRSKGRRVPDGIKRVVWRRDGGRCAYVSDGRRCEAVEWLEYDHIRPWADGGSSTEPENIRLLCRRHNQRAAALAFGVREGPG